MKKKPTELFAAMVLLATSALAIILCATLVVQTSELVFRVIGIVGFISYLIFGYYITKAIRDFLR